MIWSRSQAAPSTRTVWSRTSAARPRISILELSNLENLLRPGQAIGDVDNDALKRLMIRRTIEEHLDKELRLRPQGIKVLSLFFIDVVEYYRSYNADGAQVKGKYALMFEEEYRKAAAMPKYHTLFKEVDLASDATEVHDGYFSIDKKGAWTDTAENNQGNRENAERAYNLIMKDKEKLLSFDTKLKFIFSHSALREGWDNPNVFQICAMREMGTERERRQTIGRGLRLCVNSSRANDFAASTSTRSPSSPQRATSSSPRTSRRKSRRTPASASASWKSTSLPPSR